MLGGNNWCCNKLLSVSENFLCVNQNPAGCYQFATVTRKKCDQVCKDIEEETGSITEGLRTVMALLRPAGCIQSPGWRRAIRICSVADACELCAGLPSRIMTILLSDKAATNYYLYYELICSFSFCLINFSPQKPWWCFQIACLARSKNSTEELNLQSVEKAANHQHILEASTSTCFLLIMTWSNIYFNFCTHTQRDSMCLSFSGSWKQHHRRTHPNSVY